MAPWHAQVAAVPDERRSAERSRIDCPAQLHLTIGVRFGSLWDLSLGGARVRVSDPPRVGSEVLLKWQSHEAFCHVIWATEDMCGLSFDRALSPEMLDESLKEEQEAAKTRPAGPVAAVGNIPLGQKRRRF